MVESEIKYVVTGSAGFIGFHICHNLLNEGNRVIGIDNLSNYYDPSLKKSRNEILSNFENFSFLIMTYLIMKKSMKFLMKQSQLMLFTWQLKLALGIL